jgi:hypothetical protein
MAVGRKWRFHLVATMEKYAVFYRVRIDVRFGCLNLVRGFIAGPQVNLRVEKLCFTQNRNNVLSQSTQNPNEEKRKFRGGRRRDVVVRVATAKSL